MMKGNKKYLVIAALLLFAAISFSTYAIYKSSASGDAEASVAAWVVKVNNSDITSASSNTYTFSASDIVWDTNENVASGKIAPGSTGKIKIAIDTSGAEVAVDYTVEVDSSSIDNDKISVSNTGTNASGTIGVSESGKNIEVTVVWTAEDTTTANTNDMAMAGQNITIPVTVTLKQHTGA